MLVTPLVTSLVQPLVTPLAQLVPIFFMPLISDLSIPIGTGPATFTRSTTGTFVDKDTGLVTTAAIDAARFESNGILIEGASTNECLHSEDQSNAVWTVVAALTLTNNTGTGADGTTTADRLQYAGSLGSPGTKRSDQTITVSGGTASKTITVSVYVRSKTGISKFRIKNTHGGVIDNFSSDITVGTTLTRHDFTVTNSAAAGNGIQTVGVVAATDDSAFDIEVWGFDTEQLPFASSYIKTVASTVTRAADNLSVDEANIPGPTADYSVSAEFDTFGVTVGSNQQIYNVTGESFRRSMRNTTTTVRVFSGGGW